MECVLCNKKVEGKIENVPLTFCCAECCRTPCCPYNKVYRGRCRVSWSRALSDYGCAAEDLTLLNCESVPNPVHMNGRPMRLYLRAEVEYLGSLRQEALMAEEAERERGAIIGKRIALEESLGTSLCDINRVVCHFLLGDFLEKSANTEMTWDAVRSRYNVIDRVEEIIEACSCAHPEAVFQFCLEHPDAGPSEFKELKERMISVFRLEGARILHHLPHKELKLLVDTPLADVYDDFRERDPISIIHGHLLKWFSDETAEQIMVQSACQLRIERGGEEHGVAERLMEFWNEKDDKSKRSRKLKAALAAKQMAFPSGCHVCEQYVHGEMDYDLEEVVGIVSLNAWAQTKHFSPWSLVGDVARRTFTENMYDFKLGYDESLKKAMESAMVMCSTELPQRCIFCDDLSLDLSDYSVDGWDDFSDDEFSVLGHAPLLWLG